MLQSRWPSPVERRYQLSGNALGSVAAEL